jgi:hypothetical protein
MGLLAARLELTTAEVDLLWLLSCLELDPHVAQLAQLLMGTGMHELNVQILDKLILRTGAGSESLERLERLALIEICSDRNFALYRRSVRVNDSVLELVCDRMGLDRVLQHVATLESAEVIRAKTAGFGPEEEAATHLLARDALVIAIGGEGCGRRTRLQRMIAATDHAVLTIDARGLSSDASAMTRELRAAVRECKLHRARPLVAYLDEVRDRLEIVSREIFEAYPGPVFATAREAIRAGRRRVVHTAIITPDALQRAAMWRDALPDASDATIGACAGRYRIAPALIARAASSAAVLAADGAVTATHVHTALRAHLEQSLSDVARRIETKQTWDDLVLPVDQFDLLIELCARVRHREQVLEQWGFADKVGRGLGLSALFSGPPGTGKTMIAGLIARELGLDLYQVDLSKIVSKYIGETEKQLAALFDAAESGHAILLFDEADSLFAKRTDVKSSNDRYANLEVNYLLQRIEAFSGIAILTTNHESAIDPAFLRRLAFHIRVPMPDERQRELLWQAMIPQRAARTSDLDFNGLATRFAMSGGYIKNAALRAAFLAADAGTAIANEHLLRAARAEYEAMGKLV